MSLLKIHVHMLNARLKNPGTVFDPFISAQNSQITAKDTWKNKKCFNASVHLPGLGKNSSVLGKNDMIKCGSEMPRLRDKKTPTKINIDG